MKKLNQTLTRLHAVALGLFAATQLTSWAVSTSFTTPGGPYPFIVPAGVTSIKVQATGGGGADYQPINQPTIVTRGAVTAATLPVTPGSTLYVYVAGNGGSVKPNRGGFNGGGDGGGASGFGVFRGLPTRQGLPRLVDSSEALKYKIQPLNGEKLTLMGIHEVLVGSEAEQRIAQNRSVIETKKGKSQS
jgi:hypothetical protein